MPQRVRPIGLPIVQAEEAEDALQDNGSEIVNPVALLVPFDPSVCTIIHTLPFILYLFNKLVGFAENPVKVGVQVDHLVSKVGRFTRFAVVKVGTVQV